MRWKDRAGSENVEDGRRSGGQRMAVGGGLGGIGLILVVVVSLLLGKNPMALLEQIQPPPGQQANDLDEAPVGAEDPDAELKQFVSVVLRDTEDVWGKLFAASGQRYRQPKLHLFSREVNSACGFASAATGPFYCPADEKVYLDFSFYRDMRTQLHAPGDFAQAYVVAHEVGHHVQNLLGISDKVQSQRDRLSKVEYNDLSVRLELQADFFAGVWAHHAQRAFRFLEPGDLEEAIQCASAIGDDRLQMQSRGYVVPDSFTHGTSAQRERWFRRGFDTGDIEQGDTFNARSL